MTELEQFADTLERGFNGDSWQGNSLSELLADVTAEQALVRPLPRAHNVWELVLHIQFWHGVVRRRIQGQAVKPSDAESFPTAGTGADGWKQAIEQLRQSTHETAEAIRRFPAARLDDIVPGKSYRYRHMLSGISAHDAYHACQIAILRKGLS